MAKEGQMKFGVGISKMRKTAKSLCPICSHNVCEHHHNFLNAMTGNGQLKRTKSEISRPHKAQERVKKEVPCKEIVGRHREWNKASHCDILYAKVLASTIFELKTIQRQVVWMTKYRAVFIVVDTKQAGILQFGRDSPGMCDTCLFILDWYWKGE